MGPKSDFYEPWQQHKLLKTMEVRLNLILTMRDIYINSKLNLTKFTSSSKSTESKDIHPWNISQITTKTVPISMRIVISYVLKRGIMMWAWWKVNKNWDNNMIRISQWRESEYDFDSRSGIQVRKLTIWVRSFETTRSISSTKIC